MTQQQPFSAADRLVRVYPAEAAATLTAASVPLELATEPGTEHGHLSRPDEPAASASIERFVRSVAGGFAPAASDHQTTLSTTEGISS